MPLSTEQDIKGIIVFISAIWAVFLLEYISPVDLLSFGLTPRTSKGLVGIVSMPFLHANFQHIASNTPPLLMLLLLLTSFKSQTWPLVAAIALLGGAVLWVCGRPATHVGASGLIFGLIAYLIFSGWAERNFLSLIISVAVTFLYGGVLLSGIIPQMGSSISWDGHLAGAVSGTAISFLTVKKPSV